MCKHTRGEFEKRCVCVCVRLHACVPCILLLTCNSDYATHMVVCLRNMPQDCLRQSASRNVILMLCEMIEAVCLKSVHAAWMCFLTYASAAVLAHS